MKQGNVTAEHLRSYIERIERLEEEKAATGHDIKEVYAEAKANGFDVKAMRTIVKLRKLDPAQRDEQEYVLDTYRRAIGLLPEVE